MSNFCDHTDLEIHAGKGGDGCVHFRREKFVAYGGPDGGDGGKGGSIIFKVNPNLNTLTHLDRYKIFRAPDGEAGFKSNMHGKNGEDLTLEVPPGTLVYQTQRDTVGADYDLPGGDNANLQLLADLSSKDITFIAAQGGRGGFGNAHFISSVRQAPAFAELGEEGETLNLRLELKLMADVAIIGIPSAGKSTLISVISNAKPKIANYPFTTLIPNLGVVTPFPNDPTKTMVVADIPGLIEGASEGKGLGIEFLRHVERSRLLVHLVDPTQGDPVENFRIINEELEKFNPELAKRPQIVVINKLDTVGEEIADMVASDIKKHLKKLAALNCHLSPVHISAATTEGTEKLVAFIFKGLQKLRPIEFEHPEDDSSHKVFRPHLEDPRTFSVEKVKKPPTKAEKAVYLLLEFNENPNFFLIKGKRIEQIANQTDWTNLEGRMRVEDVLRKKGIEKELLKMGANEDDVIIIGKHCMRFKPRR